MVKTWPLAIVMTVFLAACGGGGGGGDAPATSSGDQPPAGDSSGNGNPPSTDVGSPSPTPIPSPTPAPTPVPTPSPTPSPAPSPEAFAARVSQAPDDGDTISGTIRILVTGDAIGNVELLPASGYEPLLARGVVTGDNKGAYIDFDTTVMPDGPIDVRVAAFNAGPGQGGSEITAMPARTWTIENISAPPFSALLVAAPETTAETFWLGSQSGDGSFAPTVYFEVSGTGLGNVELVSALDETVVYGRFTINSDRTRASLDWDYRSYNGWPYGTYQVRVLAWDVPPGESGRSIEVMAPRTYHQKLSLGCHAQSICGGEAP